MTVRRMDAGDCNISPSFFFKKRGDKYDITFDAFNTESIRINVFIHNDVPNNVAYKMTKSQV